jgi:hypothetical protein
VISDAVILVIAIFGLLLLILACQRLFRARFLAAGGSAVMGSLLLAVAALFFVLSLNLHTYARLTHERPVAEIVFEQRGRRRSMPRSRRCPMARSRCLFWPATSGNWTRGY